MNRIILSAARPALAPILFPFSADELLFERMTATHLHDDNAHRVPAHIIARQAAWSHRLNARIAQVVS